MMLGITKGELRIDLDLRERIVIHLAGAPRPPNGRYDPQGLPRTVSYMLRLFGISRNSITYALDALEDEHLVQKEGLLNLREGSSMSRGANVYVLTADGELLAEAIRRRAI